MSRVLRLCLRLALGAVFLYAAWTKLREPWLFAMAVDAYKLLPVWGVIVVARTLPWTELLIGLSLISGRLPRLSAAAASIVLLGFFAAMVRTYAAGIEIECGCFGPGDIISIRTLARDGTLLAASLTLTAMAWWSARAAARRSTTTGKSR
jgi:uncharacterized membrane protein YphA (DoxX/SURF4 family)